MMHEVPYDTRIFCAYLNIKDQFINDEEVNSAVKLWSTNTKNTFVEWVPNNISLSMRNPSELSLLSTKNSSWTLFNGANNIQWINKIATHFTNSFRRKAFVHHYTSDGLDQMEFTEAESNCNDLFSEYMPYENDYAMDDEENYVE